MAWDVDGVEGAFTYLAGYSEGIGTVRTLDYTSDLLDGGHERCELGRVKVY